LAPNEIGIAIANKIIFRNNTWSLTVNMHDATRRTTNEHDTAAGVLWFLAESERAFKIYPHEERMRDRLGARAGGLLMTIVCRPFDMLNVAFRGAKKRKCIHGKIRETKAPGSLTSSFMSYCNFLVHPYVPHHQPNKHSTVASTHKTESNGYLETKTSQMNVVFTVVQVFSLDHDDAQKTCKEGKPYEK